MVATGFPFRISRVYVAKCRITELIAEEVKRRGRGSEALLSDTPLAVQKA